MNKYDVVKLEIDAADGEIKHMAVVWVKDSVVVKRQDLLPSTIKKIVDGERLGLTGNKSHIVIYKSGNKFIIEGE